MGHPPLILSGRGVTAVLGPTNTGKTHLALERMLAHESGVIGLPLRLLAREVYGRVVEKIGTAHVALITGEERIIPPAARYHVCTVEAMPRQTQAAFVAIDEVQLAADFERGLHFTDRLLHLRGQRETMLLGAATMQAVLEQLLPGLQVHTRPRLSQLVYAGAKKITRLPRRSSIVAFRADEVYAIAELIRRQRGGAAVVMGALSPRTRNAQVALYQSGDVDFLIATDAIGMGLNLDVDHIAFAETRKFDGYQFRALNPAELGQIAGRAGRYLRDGSFGVTGQAAPFDMMLVEQLESHVFDRVERLQWRTNHLDFHSLFSLKRSLETPSPLDGLVKALPGVDARALERLSQDEEIAALANNEKDVHLLWDICALPDYRKIAPAQHVDIIATIYRDLVRFGAVNENYMARQVALSNSLEGEIDTISQRIAQIRTWTYVANRPNWLADPQYWQEKTRQIEDKLSDALHDKLTQRFVDRRTSILMKRLRENVMIEAEISHSGSVLVEGHHVGHLEGFRFSLAKMDDRDGKTMQPGEASPITGNLDVKTVRAAAQKALLPEYEARAERLSLCPNGDLAMASDGLVRWIGQPVASLTRGDDFLRPRVVLLVDEQLTGAALDKVRERIDRFVSYHFGSILKPLFNLVQEDGLSGILKGLAFQLVESQGILLRRDVAEILKNLDQENRASLRRLGVRFGAYHVFIPALIKPAPAQALTLLWALHRGIHDHLGGNEVIQALTTGRTSLLVNTTLNPHLYRLAGYRILGRRAVRIDILEKLADLIRVALAWRPGGVKAGARPAGAYDGRQFLVTPVMMSILGAGHGDMEEILKALGYRYRQIEVQEMVAKIAAMDGLKPTLEVLPVAEPVGPHFADVLPVGEEQPKREQQETKTEQQEKTAQEPQVKTIMLWRIQSRAEQERRAAHRHVQNKAKTAQGRAKEKQHGKAHASNTEEGENKRSLPHQAKRHANDKAKPEKEGREKFAKSSSPLKGKSPQYVKPIDPDSPFAKLAVLRDQLKK